MAGERALDRIDDHFDAVSFFLHSAKLKFKRGADIFGFAVGEAVADIFQRETDLLERDDLIEHKKGVFVIKTVVSLRVSDRT